VLPGGLEWLDEAAALGLEMAIASSPRSRSRSKIRRTV
jgi:hypothetical protein